MATWEDVRRLAQFLPETVESDNPRSAGGTMVWRVRDKSFAWERPLGRGDLDALGDAAPTGPILAVRVADEGVKQFLVHSNPGVYFTTPHFSGYPAVLVRLDRIAVLELEEILGEAWLSRAPRRLAKDWLEGRA